MSGRDLPTVSCVIAAYNEAARIAETVRTVRSLDGIDEVIVVDDGSTDATPTLAASAGARVHTLSRNEGKALAVARGVEEARGRILLLLDADLGTSAAAAGELLAPVLAGSADMTIATFPKTAHRGGFGWAVGLARWGIWRLAGRRLAAPLSGQRALVREALPGDLGKRWELEVGMTVAALRRGFRVVEVPTRMTHRLTGRTPGDAAHRAGQLVGVAKALWRHRRD